MSTRTAIPDVSTLEVPADAWTAPFWEAAAELRIALPRCTSCRDYRWPPGPFCPTCQAQDVTWTEAGPGRIYSYTVVRRPAPDGGAPQVIAPALIEFPEAGGVRLVAAVVDTPLDEIVVGAPVQALFSQAANAKVPVFRVVVEEAG